MKICNFLKDGAPRLGAVGDGVVTDLAMASGNAPEFADIAAFIEAGRGAIDHARRLVVDAPAAARLDMSTVRFSVPLMPSTVLCAGSNYHAHNAEKLNTPLSGQEPEFFLKTSDCVIGPDEGIICDPALTQKLDAETELAIVIGKPGRHIPVSQALDYVFGYTVSNDVTARDKQVRRTPEGFTWYELGRGKAFDSSLPLGPVIMTADEIPDPQALTLRTRINGELRQNASTADMIWTCAELIHFFSISFTLKPGMVILTGTPAGTAWSMDKELGGNWSPAEGLIAATRYCLPGDVIESEIVEIGILRNPIVAPGQAATM
ncbi:MAG: 5-carboxymethyl-2-hydroxymuconate isomerase [Marinosulfonomonas sp.]|nr:MAG: 5-carboxymethyl-2-hydroxymuconate isomerase [Marinosulfonomonas sp.]